MSPICPTSRPVDHRVSPGRSVRWRRRGAFTRTDLLVVVLATLVVTTLVLAPVKAARSEAGRQVCAGNLQRVAEAVQLFAEEHESVLPGLHATGSGASWWWYKEEVKGYVGLHGPSSAKDLAFACPMDRGYSDPGPFWQNPRFDYGSYVFNGVTLDESPNIAGWSLSAVSEPDRTLLVMEWTAHAPLSWHRSRTGRANAPFYRDAESVVAFADGHVDFIKIYFDGYNPAYTRDPLPGYDYRYSGN
ncbi:MAG: hypothetical protein H7A47_09745 [Verrucomicrobiales bacterium]|nr:hypothetical protein [Verrucomicrobiales bacterium]